MVQIVNVRMKYIRDKYTNLKEWMDDPNNVYIGRKCIVFIDGKRYPSNDSLWCNPYKVGRDGTLEEVIGKFKIHLDKLLENKDNLEMFMTLKDKTLGCWCHPELCHGDLIIDKLNSIINT